MRSKKPGQAHPTGAAGRALGHELDARLIYTPDRRLELMLAGGLFFPASFVELTGPSERATWVALQVLLTL